MFKKEIYPKTKRFGKDDTKLVITEKLDGSNLCFGKKNGELLICQRNTIIEFSEIEECKKTLYSGLYPWLKENGEELKNSLMENSVICGEWIAMGKLKYPFNHCFYMFAKANFNEDYTLKNIYHDHELFNYPFVNQTKPDFVNVVPIVKTLETSFVSLIDLDNMYNSYTQEVGRNVEGFVLNYGVGRIVKYVRMKNGKLEPHHA